MVAGLAVSRERRLEAAHVAQAVGVGFTGVVAAEVAAGPVGADAVAAVDEVVGADAVVDAVAVFTGFEAGEVGLDRGGAVADAAEQLEILVHGQFGDAIDGGVVFMLDRAVDAGEGEVVVLDADRGFALD